MVKMVLRELQKPVVRKVEPMEADYQVRLPNLFDIGKALQKFKGGADDHFETWEGNTRLLSDKKSSNLSDEQKVIEVILKIEGPPRMILMNHPN